MFLESPLQLSILILGLISLGYISWRRLAFGIYLIIFSLPFYLLRLKVFFIPTTVLELMIYTVFLAWLIKQLTVNSKQLTANKPENNFFYRYNILKLHHLIFLSFPRKRESTIPLSVDSCFRRNDKWLSSFYIPILLLFFGCLISTLASSDIRTSLGIFKGWFIDPLLLFLVVTSYMRIKEQVRNILISFSLSGIVIAMISIFYWLFPSFEGVTYDMRLRGFYLSPNHLAMMLAPILLITYGFFLSSLIKSSLRKKDNSESEDKFLNFEGEDTYPRLQEKKLFWIFSLAVISIPLYLTYSYGAWLGVAVGLIFISFCFLKFFKKATRRRVAFKLSIVVIVACLLFVIIFSSQLETEKFQKIFDGTRSSLQSRIMIWQAGLEILKDHPILGIGPGNFQEHYLAYQPKFPPYLEWAVPQPHNLFLAFWLQCGLIGFIGFIWIVVLFLKKGFGILKEGEDTYPRLQAKFFACILISQMIYILIHGLVDTPYWKNDLSVMFWVMMGLMIVVGEVTPPRLPSKQN